MNAPLPPCVRREAWAEGAGNLGCLCADSQLRDEIRRHAASKGRAVTARHHRTALGSGVLCRGGDGAPQREKKARVA